MFASCRYRGFVWAALDALERSRPLTPFAVAVACALLPLRGALFPDIAPGPNDIPQFVRDRAALLWVLCWLPAIHYSLLSRQERRPIPFLPVIGVLYGLYYALAPMLGQTNLLTSSVAWTLPSLDPSRELAPAVNLALAGWVMSMIGYAYGRLLGNARLLGVRRATRELRLPTVVHWALASVVVGIAVALFRRLVELPLVLRGVATLVNMLMHAALIVLVYLIGRGYFASKRRRRVATLVALAAFVQLGTGATYPVIYIAFCIFVGMWLAHQRIRAWWYVAAAVLILTFMAVRGAMVEWRARVWFSGVEYGPVARSVLLTEILARDIDQRGTLTVVNDGLDLIVKRSANSDLLADVVRRTPRDIPFWDGFTYNSLVGAFVPRALWPNKPQKTLGQDFGHRYAYLGATDRHTSINLPVLIELYINFGVDGVIFGMFVVGLVYCLLQRICNQPGQSVLTSAAGTQILIPLFVIECDFSLQFGGALMQLAAMGLLLYVIRGLQRRRDLRHVRPTPTAPVCVPAALSLCRSRRFWSYAGPRRRDDSPRARPMAGDVAAD